MINRNAARMKHLVISPQTMITITTLVLHYTLQDLNEDIHIQNRKKRSS